MTEAPPPVLDSALHSAPRIAIVGRLSFHKEMRFSRLREVVGMTAGNLASHLERLERAGYVQQRDALVALKPGRLLGLTARGREAFAAYAKQLERLLVEVKESVNASDRHSASTPGSMGKVRA